MRSVIREAKEIDFEHLIENIREEDVVEIDALTGSTVREVLDDIPELVERSNTWEVDGEVVCIFGVTPCEQKGVGLVWLLATEAFKKYTKLFALVSKQAFREVANEYSYLFNYIHSENKESIKWLKWLGFTVGDPEPIGITGANFQRFEMLNV